MSAMDKGELCAGCSAVLSENQYMKCNTCKLRFDIICAGFSESSFKKLSKSSKYAWVCFNCRSKMPKTDNSNTPVRQAQTLDTKSVCDTISPGENVTQRNKTKRDATITKDILSCETNEGRIRQIIRDEIQCAVKEMVEKCIGTFCNEIKEFKESLTFFNSQFEELKQEIKDRKLIIERLDKENKDLRQSLTYLRTEMNLLQQQSRSNNLEIQCVPESKSENLYSLVKQLATTVKCDITEQEVLHCARIAKQDSKSTRPRSIIVKFSSQRVRDKVLASCIKYNKLNSKEKLHASHLGISSEKIVPIFIAEHLSPENKSIHAASRRKAKELNYKYVWVRNGHVFMRKTDFSERIFINSVEKLNNLSS